MGGKLKYFIVSILIAAILAGIGVGIYMSWPAITGTINDSKYYTSEDIQSSYDKGYNDGINNETELNAQLEYYRTLVDEYYAQIVDYKNQNSELQKSNQSLTESVKSLTDIKLKNEKTIADLEKTVGNNNETISNLRTEISNKEEEISSLEDEKLSLQNQVSALKDDISDKKKIIADLELDLAKNKTEIEKLKLEVEDCETQITILQNDIANKEKQIEGLQNQVESLSALVLQLQEVNRLNLETIKTLSSQIVTLNSQISELKNQIEDNSSNVSALEDKISKLQDTIKYYENYIKNLESDTQVVVTFEFNEVVYNIQVVAKNSRVFVVNPTDTDYVKFNYWTVDGEKIDLENYTFSGNKKVIADCTFFQKVTFMNDSQVAKEEFVERGKTTTAPSVSKDGFDFDGWTINGQDTVVVNDYQVDKDTTFTAKYTQLFTVTFMYESETKSIQSVRSGEYASNVDVDSTTYKIFNYWTVNGVRVDVSSYTISANTVFVADITYKFDVKFMVDDVQYKETQIITKNGYASVPSNPSKDKFEFDGWTINGQDVVNVATYPITQTTTFIAKFTRVYVVKFQALDQILSTQNVRADKTFTIPDVSLSGYNFEGWSIDGESIIDISQYKLLDDVTFIAVLTAKVGMFSEDGKLIYSWSDLISEDSSNRAFTFVNDGFLKWYNRDILSNYSENFSLIIDSSVKGFYCGSFSDYFNFSGFEHMIEFDCSSCLEITYLSPSMFKNCFNLKSVSLPDSITSFDGESFYGCRSLSEIVIPLSLTSCGSNCFYGCSSLKKVNIKTLDSWFNISFSAYSPSSNPCYYSNSLYLNDSELKSISVPDGITELHTFAFAFLENLEFVKISSSVTTFSQKLFVDCKKLNSLYIPITVKTIYGLYNSANKSNHLLTFVGANSSMVIYCEATENQSGWGQRWNSAQPFDEYDDYGYTEQYWNPYYDLSVMYGYSYESYLEAVGLSDISLSNSISYLDEIIIPNKYYFEAC